MPHRLTGRVYLVGAGPGDPELLTVKAYRLIEASDVILHDALVPVAILSLARSQSKVVNVGKRCGSKRISQAEIDALMIDSAQRGLQVLRLHGGDPSIFGRLAEEIDALETAGIAFEVVPGITAATAAAAQIGVSLTDRRKSSRVVIVSGHRALKDSPREAVEWKELARGEATLVIYMPGNNFATLREELLSAGLGLETPAVIVSRASIPGEGHLFTTLGELESLPRLESPAVLLIGRSLDRAQRKPNLKQSARAFDEADFILSSF
jgi:uroporphyrin-III C-methyltransferase